MDKGGGDVQDILGRVMGNMSFGTLQGQQESTLKTGMWGCMSPDTQDPED